MKKIITAGSMPIYCIILLLTLNSCSSSGQISLEDWVKDHEIYARIYEQDLQDCDEIHGIYENLKLPEFKSKLYGKIIACSEDEEEVREYILKSVKAGIHPSRIDAAKFPDLYSSLTPQMNMLYEAFWQERDTSFFMEMERRVLRDQDMSQSAASRIKVFEENTEYLINYCKEKGYPRAPKVSNFQSFRSKIRPSTIAIHADPNSKLTLLKYAVASARKGDISWYDPVTIAVGFFTNDIRTKTKPIFLMQFEESGKLDVNSSYLQLYAIKKLYHDDMPSKISIQPSKFNKMDSKIIAENLLEMKAFLVSDLGFEEKNIEISNQPAADEVDYSYITPYGYTIVAVPS